MSTESLSWEDMEDGKEYEVTVKGTASVWKWPISEDLSLKKGVTLFKHNQSSTIVLGFREINDPDIIVRIASVGESPVPLTKEEKIEARKRWDARYDEQSRG